MAPQIDITAHFIRELELILELVDLHLQLLLLGESPIQLVLNVLIVLL